MTTYYDMLGLMLATAKRMRSSMFPCPASDLYMRLCSLEQALESCIDATPEGEELNNRLVVDLGKVARTNDD